MKEGQKWIDLPEGVADQIAKDFNVSRSYVSMICDYKRNAGKAKMLRQVALQRGGKILMASKVSFSMDLKKQDNDHIASVFFNVGNESFEMAYDDTCTGGMLASQLYKMFARTILTNKDE